ncbi:LuxR C-terminal-related transcriptional regulator [Microbacterium sp. 179-B 1A2 NHS]|uniref:helix-turn-helix transcriptional regulator n=1 Tax=Microbacterium sp. 179-B 1A2 NHS TaxID=3142383 RepID=UPI00399F9533
MFSDASPRTPAPSRDAARASAPHTRRSPSESLSAFLAESAVTPLLAVELPIRGVVSGPVGAGKSAALAALRAELSERGLRIGATPSGAAAVDVVVIDDAESLAPGEMDALQALVAESDASVVVAHLPRPTGELRAVSARLQKTCPPALLGEITPEQIVEVTRIPAHCAQAIVEQTGGLTWLTLAAVDAHDPGVCGVDPTHRDLSRTLRTVIAHRLDSLDDAHRHSLEALCTLRPSELALRATPGMTWDAMVADGCTAGLLAPNGAPPPVVRTAVRALVPAHRMPEGSADVASAERVSEAWRDTAASTPSQLIARADGLRTTAPAQAWALYRQAAAASDDPTDVALAIGIAAFNAGDPDAAGAAFDRLLPLADHPHRALAADAAAAVWASRGVLEVGAALHADTAGTAASRARAALITLGRDARLGGGGVPPLPGSPDTLSVASDALTAALTDSVGDDVGAAVDDLVVASELYSSTHSDFPLVEPPAVVAAAAALSTGRLALAASVLESAQARRQCGHWARARILLWRAWIAILAAEPLAATTLLTEVAELDGELVPRDRLILAACETALARRYATTAELITVFHGAAREIHQQRFDVFLFPFLGELSLAAARTDTPDTTQRQVDAALSTLAAAGEPPLWSPLLHWNGIQRGILLGRPELLVPHAHVLLAAAAHSPFAARLATAGRVWTDVLAGRVDPVAVQDSARDLRAQGLAWDGARLAAHGAARTTDRQVYAQLLACARELHPTQAPRSASGHEEPTMLELQGTALSDRETEVARLVLQGKTYIEIGQSLFISPRTAEHHIARIRRRVDATSRSDLLTKLRAMLGGEDGITTSHTQEDT